jgi:hypothetical protein
MVANIHENWQFHKPNPNILIFFQFGGSLAYRLKKEAVTFAVRYLSSDAIGDVRLNPVAELDGV